MSFIDRSRQTTPVRRGLKLLQLCAASVVLCLTGTVHAQVKDLARQSGWKAYGGLSGGGRKVCGMSVTGGGRYLGIKYFAGDSHLTVQLSKNTWRVKPGLHVRVLMQFDRRQPWTTQAEAIHLGNDGALQFMVGRKSIREFTRELVRGHTLYVRFPDEHAIEDWQADLAGTPTVTGAWASCLEAMAGAGSHDADDEV